MIKETYHIFKVVHDASLIDEDWFINLKALDLHEAYTKVIDISHKKVGLENVKLIEYKGTDVFELYE